MIGRRILEPDPQRRLLPSLSGGRRDAPQEQDRAHRAGDPLQPVLAAFDCAASFVHEELIGCLQVLD